MRIRQDLSGPTSPRVAARAFLIVLLCHVIAGVARADDQPSAQFTLGAKVWDTQWTSWDIVASRSAVTNGGPVTVVEPVSTNDHFAVIPQASVRYADFLGSASYFVNNTYNLTGAYDPESGSALPVSALRKELDGNIGYYVLSSVALTVGYKQIEQTFGPNSKAPELFKWTGPTLGISGSAPLRAHFGLYGAIGVGFLRLRVDEKLHDAVGETSFKAIYTLAELGASYSIPTPTRLSYTITLGYRAQIVTTENYALANGFSNGYNSVDVHDTTQGPALTFVGRY